MVQAPVPLPSEPNAEEEAVANTAANPPTDRRGVPEEEGGHCLCLHGREVQEGGEEGGEAAE